MKYFLIMMSILLASLLGFVGYCWLLIDWYQNIQLGRYEQEPLETIIQTGVVVAYCYIAYRFIQTKSILRPSSNKPTYNPLRKLLTSSTTRKAKLESDRWLRSRPHRSR